MENARKGVWNGVNFATTMNTKQFHRRVWAMVLLLALMITGMGAALYDLQINNGESYWEKTQKKVAEALYITPATAHSHIKRIYSKCGLHSRQEILEYLTTWGS